MEQIDEQVGAPVTASDGSVVPHRVGRFLTVWWFGGLVAAALVLLSTDLVSGPPIPAWPLVAALLGLTVISHLGGVKVRIGRSGQVADFVETALVGVLLLLPSLLAFGVAVAGIALAESIDRRPRHKIAFNVATTSIGTAAAIATLMLVRGGAEPMSWRGIVAVALAVGIYGVTTFLGTARVIGLLEGEPFREALKDGWQLLPGTGLNVALGIAAVHLWNVHPGYVLVLVLPLAGSALVFKRLARQRQQHALTRRELDRLERILGGTTDGITLIDERGRVEVWNAAMVVQTLVRPVEAVGRPIAEVLDLRDADDLHVDLGAVVESFAVDSRPWTRELSLAVADSTRRHVRVTVSASDGGQVGRPGAVVVLADLTRQREADRAKDDFLMRVTHELRTPLTPIKGYAETLRNHPDKVEPKLLSHALDRIAERADQMKTLIDDLLVVAAEHRAPIEHRAEARPVDAAHRVRSLASRVAKREGRSITVEADGTFTCLADPIRLDRIIDVLLDNAVTYSPASTPIKVTLGQEGDRVVVSVRDRGRGIPADHLDRIFDRFHRVEDPLLMETGGLGIGLYLARRFATSLDGSLEVESAIGQGSTFRLVLPAFRASDRATASAC